MSAACAGHGLLCWSTIHKQSFTVVLWLCNLLFNMDPLQSALRSKCLLMLVSFGLQQVLLSVSCVLVAPKRKLAGRLEVMRSSIHFYGEFVVEGTGGQSVFSSSGGLNYPEVTSIEKSSSKSKGNSRREEVADMEKVNVMERLEPMHHSAMHGGPWKDIKRHSRWDLCQVSTCVSQSLLCLGFGVNLKP